MDSNSIYIPYVGDSISGQINNSLNQITHYIQVLSLELTELKAEIETIRTEYQGVLEELLVENQSLKDKME